MSAKRGRPTKIGSVLRKAGSIVKPSEAREALGNTTDKKIKQRLRPLPEPMILEVEEADETTTTEGTDSQDIQINMGDKRKTDNFEVITVTGSKGQKYRIAVPASFRKGVPRVWKWNAERYRVAELIASGVPISQIPDDPQVSISRMTIYAWLEHPEFREHVDGLVMETGFANKRERIANLNRLTKELFNKVMKELDGVKLTDKSIGAVLTAIRDTAKLIAQEKEEFVEESKITQDTNITGTVVNVEAKLENFLQSKTDEEREALEKEFDKIGDDIIRALTGDK